MPLSVIEADVNFNKTKQKNKNLRQQMNEQIGKKNPSLHYGIIRAWENICDTMLYDKRTTVNMIIM